MVPLWTKMPEHLQIIPRENPSFPNRVGPRQKHSKSKRCKIRETVPYKYKELLQAVPER